MLSLILLAHIGLAVAEGTLDLKVGRNGAFTIELDSVLWLKGSEVRVGSYSSSDGTLKSIGGPTLSVGSDTLGDYTETKLGWAKENETVLLMETSFREYKSDEGLLVFSQRFPEMLLLGGQENASLSALTIFPAFDSISSPDLPCFSYHGVFPAMVNCTLSTYEESEQGGAPLVLYDPSNPTLPMAVFSPLATPKASHMAHAPNFVGAGVKSTVTEIPAGWEQLFVLSAGLGMNAGMMKWGDRMLKYAGVARVDNRYLDAVHGKIGFWTDNGGYYHYSTGTNESYEDVLPKVRAYHDELGVPFGHWQFDSWFYPKDGGVDPGGGGGAVTNWTSLDDVFPSGMAAIQKQLNVPMVMHNRQWSPRSDYIKHEDFEWWVSPKAAVPKDPEAFFSWFFMQQKGWGLAMYEQDWMNKEYSEVEALQTNISLADEWLRGMARGAARSGRSVQYCMPYPLDVLSGARLPSVTNVRATGDYFHAAHQWAVGQTGLFYWALNKLPFKDGFYSSSLPQLGGQTVGPEEHPDREALMAVLSAAMVGPMDGLGLLNATRVMATCRADGVVLKPDRPLTPPDACFRAPVSLHVLILHVLCTDLAISESHAIPYKFLISTYKTPIH